MTTLEQLRALPDEQLLEQVAVAVLGWQNEHKPRNAVECLAGRCLVCNSALRKWNPLTDWNHTMQVVERMYTHWDSRLCLTRRKGGRYDVSFTHPVHDTLWASEGESNGQWAICLAALRAVS